MLVVVDHDTGRLIHAAVGATKKTMGEFFNLVGDERARKITLVSADAAPWIAEVVGERCANATLCIDPFHVVKWATDALDKVRRQVWNEARRSGMKGYATDVKGKRASKMLDAWPRVPGRLASRSRGPCRPNEHRSDFCRSRGRPTSDRVLQLGHGAGSRRRAALAGRVTLVASGPRCVGSSTRCGQGSAG